MDVNEHTERWDLISLSLVVNFVPEPKERGDSFPIACLAVLTCWQDECSSWHIHSCVRQVCYFSQ